MRIFPAHRCPSTCNQGTHVATVSRVGRIAGFALALAGGAPAPKAHAESAIAAYVAITGTSVQEGDSGATEFTATLTSSWYSTLDVYVSALPGTAQADDYSFETTKVTLLPGKPVQVRGTVKGDVAPEEDETFRLTVVGNGAYPGYVSSGDGTITIVDDDQTRAPRVHVEGSDVAEGDEGRKTATARIWLEQAATSPVVVGWGTADATASGNVDYKPTSGSVRFEPGQIEKTVAVEVNGDTDWESDETLTVDLVSTKLINVVNKTAAITIRNDDAASHPHIDNVTVVEGNSGITRTAFKVTYDRPVPPASKLWVTVSGGSARQNEDFLGGFQIIYPDARATQTTFTVETLGDTKSECSEGVIISYRAIYTGDDEVRTARLLIVDDDSAPSDAGASANCPDPFIPLSGGEPLPDVVDAGVSPQTPSDAATMPAVDAGAGAIISAVDAPVERPRGAASDGCSMGGSRPAYVLGLLASVALLLLRRRLHTNALAAAAPQTTATTPNNDA